MKKPLEKVWFFILGSLLILLLVIFLVQARLYMGSNPIVRQRIEVQEAFQNEAFQNEAFQNAKKVEDVEDINLQGMFPADASLNQPRQPYSLLLGWLPLATETTYTTAERCRGLDFQPRLERTGNFRQLTNNYKRGDPDSCSGPIQDLSLAFYKTTPVP
jgi:hypothetical protein